MASFYKTLAVCLMAFSGLQSVAGSDKTYTWTAEGVTADAYLSVKLARNGKLPVHISDVAKDDQLVATLKTTIEGTEDGRAVQNCRQLIESKETLKDLFYRVLEPTAKGERDYRQLLQASLDEGLEAFKPKEYPKTTAKWQELWTNPDFANLAYLLSSNSTKVGCVIGTCTGEQTLPPDPPSEEGETTVEMELLICDLDPPATKNQAPFDEEYFTGLIERTAKLASMTEDDLKAPTNDGTAAAAVPTIMFAGLVAMLTAISA
ncbi:SAG family member [Eimeria brunetti]|uniref:SAG family member n=1 Tax=Eimeria brunetti TaxID=51314 RepID=U6L624_9EIME|nr:SAG family member [Eimeria brunetti]